MKKQPSSTPNERDDEEISRVTRKNRKGRRDSAHTELMKRLREAKSNPIKAMVGVQRRIGMTRAEYDAALVNDVVVGYASAQRLAADHASWVLFANEPFWAMFDGHKPKPDEPSKHVKWVLLFIFEVCDELGKARVDSYRNALEPSFQNGTEPHELVALLQQHRGIEKLRLFNRRSARSASDKEKHATKADAPKKDRDTSDDLFGGDGDDNSEGDASGVDFPNEPEDDPKAPSSGGFKPQTPAQKESSEESRYWADFLKRAKAIEASGRRPLLVAVNESNFREATAVDRKRPAIFQLHREPIDEWVHIVAVPYRRAEE